jgi:hypothetical protein
VSLFTDSSFTVFSDFEFVLYDVFYDFEWMNILFSKKKKQNHKGIGKQ